MSSSKTRISRVEGPGVSPLDGHIGWLQSPATAARGGKFYIRDLTDPTILAVSTNRANYVTIEDSVDSTSAQYKFDKARGLNPGIEAGKQQKCLILVPGVEFEIETYASTGTGAITTSTSIDGQLGVNATGFLCEKQSSGAGSTALARLIGNHITARNTVRIKWTG